MKDKMKKILGILIVTILLVGIPPTVAIVNQNMECQEYAADDNEKFIFKVEEDTVINVNVTNEKLVLAFYYPWYIGDQYWPIRAAHHPMLGAYDSS